MPASVTKSACFPFLSPRCGTVLPAYLWHPDINTGKVLPYSLPSVGPGVDSVVHAVSPRGFISPSTGSRIPLLSARLVVIFPAKERHRPLTNTKLYWLVVEAHRCEQLVQGCYKVLSQWELNPQPIDRKSHSLPLYHCATCHSISLGQFKWLSKHCNFIDRSLLVSGW